MRVHWSLVLVCISALNYEIEAKTKNRGPSISPRIMSGSDADPGEAPYQCSLQIKSKHFCGCAILNSRFILSAAHCLLGERPRDVEVLVGTNNLKAGGTRYKTNKTFIHEDYDKSNYAYDIALLRVQSPIEFNSKVQPIEISHKVIQPGTPLKVTGWGFITVDGKNPVTLQKLYVKSISNEVCARSFDEVHKSHLCTLGYEFGERVGSGDSGGPLVTADGKNLVGISSFADPEELGDPNGFARLSLNDIHDWIERKMKMP